jgi:hypothetical protein
MKFGVWASWAMLAFAGQLLAQTANDSEPDSFPVIVQAEVVRGESVTVKGAFRFYLPAGADRHVPVNERIAEELDSFPFVDVKTEAGSITPTFRFSRCTPAVLRRTDPLGVSRVGGARMDWKVDLSVTDTATPTVHEVELHFPKTELVQRLAARQEKIEEKLKPQIIVQLQVWESAAAKSEAEAKKRAERKQALKLQAQAAFEKKMKWSLVGLVLLLVGVGVFLLRRRFWPDARVTLSPGQHVQQKEAIAARADFPHGTLVETLWACDWRGRRQPVKVELLAGTADTPDLEAMKRRVLGNDGPRASSVSLRQNKLDVLVTAGARVARGTLLATGRCGSVRVQIR